jgi:multidrug efflux pump subunit AcrA (membrane-fusion protein)
MGAGVIFAKIYLGHLKHTDTSPSGAGLNALLTELEVPNPTGRLFPGAYVQVTLKIDPPNGALTIPAGTLLFRSGKPAVGIVHENGKVEIR